MCKLEMLVIVRLTSRCLCFRRGMSTRQHQHITTVERPPYSSEVQGIVLYTSESRRRIKEQEVEGEGCSSGYALVMA